MNNFINNLFNLNDKVAVIFGAGGHLCSQISKGLALSGCHLSLLDIRTEKIQILKKEYHMPLAIIFGTIIISIAIYLGSTAEYRGLKRSCIIMAGEKYKTMESGAKNIWLTACMSRMK